MGVLAGFVLISFIGACVMMGSIDTGLIVLPFLEIGLVALSIYVSWSQDDRKGARLSAKHYTTEEKKILKEKEDLDAKNKKENADRYAPIFLQETAKASGRIQELENRCAQCETEIKVLEGRIKNNGYLTGDDIQWTGKVIDYIQSRRADSIKEALHLVDMELDRERRDRLSEQRHKEMMEELEYQSYEAARMREEQRESAERAEKAQRDSEAATERARYEAEQRAYEEAYKAERHRQNVEWELRNKR